MKGGRKEGKKERTRWKGNNGMDERMINCVEISTNFGLMTQI